MPFERFLKVLDGVFGASDTSKVALTSPSVFIVLRPCPVFSLLYLRLHAAVTWEYKFILLVLSVIIKSIGLSSLQTWAMFTVPVH